MANSGPPDDIAWFESQTWAGAVFELDGDQGAPWLAALLDEHLPEWRDRQWKAQSAWEQERDLAPAETLWAEIGEVKRRVIAAGSEPWTWTGIRTAEAESAEIERSRREQPERWAVASMDRQATLAWLSPMRRWLTPRRGFTPPALALGFAGVGRTAPRARGAGRPAARRTTSPSRAGPSSDEPGEGEPGPGPGRLTVLYSRDAKYGRINRALARWLRERGR